MRRWRAELSTNRVAALANLTYRTEVPVMDRGNTGSVPRNSLAESITGVAKEVRKPQCWQENYSI